MQGVALRETIVSDEPVREAALYGIHGGHVNVTDGRHAYMRASADDDNQPIYNYTLMSTHMRHPFKVEELTDIMIQSPFSFTKGCQTMKIGTGLNPFGMPEFETLLFDVEADPGQLNPIEDAAVEAQMIEKVVDLMRATDAPSEQYERLGLA